MNVGSNVLAVLLAAFFFALGAAKVLAVPRMRALAAEVGVSVTAYRGIGALELAGAGGLVIGLVVPLLGTLAGSGLALLLAGAIATHLRAGQGPGKFAPALVSLLLVAAYLAVHLGATW